MSKLLNKFGPNQLISLGIGINDNDNILKINDNIISVDYTDNENSSLIKDTNSSDFQTMIDYGHSTNYTGNRFIDIKNCYD